MCLALSRRWFRFFIPDVAQAMPVCARNVALQGEIVVTRTPHQGVCGVCVKMPHFLALRPRPNSWQVSQS